MRKLPTNLEATNEQLGPNAQILGTELIDFPSLALGENYDAFVQRVEAVEPGKLALIGAEFSGLVHSSHLKATFELNPRDAEGRTNGRHQVYFGKLELDSDQDHRLPTSVAVKPYTHSSLGWVDSYPEDTLANEWAANDYINQLSDDEKAYLPLGVWRMGSGAIQLVSLFDEPVQTFDNIFWPSQAQVADASYGKIVKALDLSFYTLGLLHGAGVTHGDAHIGNFGRDSQGARLIDLETVERLGSDQEGHVFYCEQAKREINGDFSDLIASITFDKMLPEEIYQKVQPLIDNNYVVEAFVRSYWGGIAQGQARSGYDIDEKLVIDAEGLSSKFQFVINNRDSFLA